MASNLSAVLFFGAIASAFAQAPAPAPAPPPPAIQLPPATDPAVLHVAPGFKVDLLYTVPRVEQGSWVAMTVDPKGRLIVSDQYGGVYRVTLPSPNSTTGTKVEPLKTGLTGAHGLLYAFNSLYVMVNEDKAKSGLWRLRDTTGDDDFAAPELLRTMNGSGEHGPHALVLSPDGQSIYFTNGNHTDLPKDMEKSRPVGWGEDHLLPRMWDARGHARDKYAPGGYIARMDRDGKTIDLFSMGFRNAFDVAFDQNGELFTYDSDMEWDQGSPWYLPTRINHAVSGADFGWRSGAGRWPAYYADSLPGAIDLGPGCPTGLTFGTNAKFSAKYQRALFACDWTFGTLYAIHLQPDGASYRAEREEFITGKPLPLTDLVINPHDGAMYFAVGGRRTQAALYRVTYVGSESTAPATIAPPNAAALLRRSIEALHADGVGPEAIDQAWPHLANADRFIRFAARVAIERQPAEKWAERALAEKNPQAAVEALIALARRGDRALQPRLIAALERLEFAALPADLRLPVLRAWQLAFTRMGKPAPDVCARLAAKWDVQFPHADRFVNRELVSLLIYLDSPTVVAKTIPLLSVSEPLVRTAEAFGGPELTTRNDSYGKVVDSVGASRPDRQQIHFAYNLRNATAGWTPKLHADYFSWFARTRAWKGGASFEGFLRNIRTDALTHVADSAERAALDGLSKPPSPAFMAAAIPAKGPGRSYATSETATIVSAKMQGRDFAQGRAMFSAGGCIVCHRFNGEGGGIGPDLSVAGSRYSVRDLLENIIEPSRVISDQYGTEQILSTDGATIVGRVAGEENGELIVLSNPFMPEEKVRVKTALVKSRSVYPVSMMPPGLINSLNESEVSDLVAYILSGGNSSDKLFRPAP